MISKNRLKELATYRQQKVCDQEKVFIVEGIKMAREAYQSGATIRYACYTSPLGIEPIVEACPDSYEVSSTELERLSLQKSPNQVWLLCEKESWSLPNNNDNDLIVALDHLQDPGNLGTIIRTADWFGIRHIICSRDSVNCYNPKVVQSTMGGIFRTRIDYTDLPEWLSQCGRPICGALLDGTPVEPASLPHNAVLVIGNESRGISPEVAQMVKHKVLIPNIGGTAESLNASVAAAILMAMIKL